MDFKREIFRKLNTTAGGNSDRTLSDLASDILNACGKSSKEIASDTCLSVATVERIRDQTAAKSGAKYSPQSDTLERVFKTANFQLAIVPTKVGKKYSNKKK
jgi:DNA-binding NarL/FixJ family response regulator